VSYLVGSLPFGLWVGLWWKGIDIRTLGSQNIGATNALRVLGTAPGLTVMLLDTLKGSAGIVLAWALLPGNIHGVWSWLPILIGLLAIVGHSFSIFLRFKGGKGVSSTLGAMFALNWQIALIALAIWLVLVGTTRYVSVGSLVGGVSIPVTAYFLLQGPERWWMVGLGIVVLVLVTIKHRGNIQRLLAGTEAKIGQRVEIPTDTAEGT